MVAAPQPPESWTSPSAGAGDEVVYPDSDGQPIADNTRQFAWIVLLKENLDAMGIRFSREGEQLVVYRPDGARFLSFQQLEARAREATARADEATARADEATARADRLAAQLAALGVEPE